MRCKQLVDDKGELTGRFKCFMTMRPHPELTQDEMDRIHAVMCNDDGFETLRDDAQREVEAARQDYLYTVYYE